MKYMTEKGALVAALSVGFDCGNSQVITRDHCRYCLISNNCCALSPRERCKVAIKMAVEKGLLTEEEVFEMTI